MEVTGVSGVVFSVEKAVVLEVSVPVVVTLGVGSVVVSVTGDVT